MHLELQINFYEFLKFATISGIFYKKIQKLVIASAMRQGDDSGQQGRPGQLGHPGQPDQWVLRVSSYLN